MRDFAIFVGLVLVWGSTWLAVKVGLETAPPFWFATIRFAISFVLLGAIILIRKPNYTPVRRNVGKIMVAGTAAYGICYALIYWGQRFISSGTASVLFASIPFFAAMLSALWLPEEKVTPLKVTGIVIGFAGLIVIFLGDISLRSELAAWGAVMVVLSAAVAAFTAVYVKRYLRNVDSLLLTHTQMIPGFIMLLVLALIHDELSALRFDTKTVITTLYLAIFGTAFAFWGYFHLLARTNVVKLSLIGFLTPVIAIFLGWIALDEEITARFAVGVAMVLAGVWFASKEPESGHLVPDQKS